ncbi:MAG: hypothetical protein CMJ76_13805 [Planctomycetaceae bacterium]|nr:hypothetical protein [Planctomycetaceae bacterium]
MLDNRKNCQRCWFIRPLACFFLTSALVPVVACPADMPNTDNRSRSIDPNQRQELLKDLPSIQMFKKSPPSRFLVDLSDVRRGHPYMGRRAERPHTGGHIYFKIPENINEFAAKDYPPIYAVADGVVTRVDYSYELRSMFEPALEKVVANKRYGIGLTFAKDGTTDITFHYSIEPFVRPQNVALYEQFIYVKPGQKVIKGQVIARMYIPNNKLLAQKSHIHFNLLREGGGGFISPSIFNTQVVREFHKRWNLFPNNPDAPIPPCMGYLLQPEENPFLRRAVDAL